MADLDLEGLKRVDQVNSLIKKLVENNDNNDALFKDIDNFLSNKESKAFDKTVINKSKPPVIEDSNEAFMKDLESDAKERSERRAAAKAKAEIIKCKANDYFKACDYEKSIKYYSRAINECKDYDILYTNRAQAYLKIDRVNEALADCEMALRISPRNHKALLHKGRSLVRLDRFDEAIESYTQVVDIAPNLKKYMEEFFEESRKLKCNLEMKQISADAFDETNERGKETVIGEVLEKLLSKPDERLEFYVGGLEMILHICVDNKTDLNQLKADFKLGVGIFNGQSEIDKRCRNIISTKIQNISEMELQFLSLWLQLMRTIVKDDEACIVKIFNDPLMMVCIDFCCKSAKSIPFSLLSPTVFILYLISNIDVGVPQIFDKFNVNAILSITITAINLDHKKEMTNVGVELFHNLVRSQRFKIALSKEEKLIMSAIDCMHALFVANLSGSCGNLASVISIIELMADNSTIRLQLLRHDNFLDDCMNTIEARLTISDDENHSSALLQLFTLIHNLLIRSKNCSTSGKVKSLCQRIVVASSYLLSNNPVAEIRNVLVQILSQMLVVLPDDKLKSWCENNPTTVSPDQDNVSMCRSLSRHSSLTDIGYLDKVCKPLKLCITILDAHNHPLLPNAIKILALASKVNQPVRFLCCDVRERVLKLQSLLYKEKEQLDEVFSGNICLLFINCVNETPLAEHLSNTGIIKDLLRICADSNKTDCKRNAAIFAGNLAQSNHIHRNELSRLNGFNIISKFNTWSN